MRAVYYERRGAAREVLVVGERAKPKAARGEVLVRVAVSGVNPSDVKTRAGQTVPMTAPLVIPHCDGAGTIEAVGDGVPAERVGERVWLYNVNRTPDGHGQSAIGTAAEFVAVDAQFAVRLPGNVGFAEGAGLGVPALTAHRACFCAGPLAGKTVLVTGGAGAVGFYAVQMARLDGARVIATVSNEEKATIARDGGADVVIDYRREDVARRIMDETRGGGVDHVVDVDVAANAPIIQAVLRPEGVVAPYATGAKPAITFENTVMMRKGAQIRWVYVYTMPWAAQAAAAEDVNRWLKAGRLRHRIAAHFPLERIVAAHELVESGRQIGKVVVDIA
ncbi:MAG: NADPH:quinone reductase [Alphaproteobacteria bacterium]|nr:NADPH:quinone reductase [Alphaproteobacteria bacterium]